MSRRGFKKRVDKNSIRIILRRRLTSRGDDRIFEKIWKNEADKETRTREKRGDGDASSGGNDENRRLNESARGRLSRLGGAKNWEKAKARGEEDAKQAAPRK